MSLPPRLLPYSSTISWRHDFFPSPSVFKGLLGAILACWCKRHKKVGTQPTYVDGHLLTFPHQATPPLLSMGPAQLEQNQFTQNKSNGLRGTVASGRISRWIRWPSGPPVFFFSPRSPPLVFATLSTFLNKKTVAFSSQSSHSGGNHRLTYM